MLSYRHAFHAGNHADVLKHCIEVMLLDYMNQKDKPWWYIDTHAGAGVYSLTQGYATKNAEFETGIARLWQRNDLPTALQLYVNIVKDLNAGNAQLQLYPGSPYVAQALQRSDDKLRLFELHPSDSKLLAENFLDAGRAAKVMQADGFASIKSVLPPPPRRGLTLIDPPYEEKHDYVRVVDTLKAALERFPTGSYAVWYPQLSREESKQLPEKLKKLGAKSWVHAALTVHAPRADGFGMHGSGMFILNPPWTLANELKEIMPYLVQHLGIDKGAKYILEQLAA
ncbi:MULTISPECIES: 23S rRNA (adenine(2030)-N(6))-methyltransferase RlmJ [Deefgea]|uniref:Ribosomal RNA large subunit methyltransferase J n=1 Tax=Deefgea chitinilytica TaxID=570276 RepID=A0ABS2CF20_9NEIS|nr:MULTISPECIES: 23S rRNA (adenine(2030)-N(6))-methyltransferase RlmJ [Deefgea]MBM5572602.1 23S rRNA (adenine(2030)-N(6))-methyltransferase RlmJ [Deefgea chitinilytica]MBM9889838.1 23S rRNA (adenine(2030)-N(6))-methyltransferase RlmJ [Deefgea sp. CFH1-16]